MFGNNLFDKAFNLFSRVEEHDFEYVYRGYFTHNITKKILILADLNIQKSVPVSVIQRRIYHIMVEGLQNITRHQDQSEDANEKYPGIFAIQQQEGRYYITTGNLVFNEKIKYLKEKIQEINSLDNSELRKIHKEILRSGAISDKGGAGLGLIEMARKSSNKLISSFELINEKYSYFYLQAQIPATERDNTEQREEIHRKFLISIKKLHISLVFENILLYFNGFFNQNNLLSLISIIKGRLDMSLTSIRLTNMMVEMIQNIIKHGVRTKQDLGNPGIFFIQQREDNIFVLTSGNYIREKDAMELKEKIKTINELSLQEVNEYYNDKLLDLASVTPKKSGLGLPDMRLKSGQKLVSRFHKVKEDLYFYILQITLNNQN